MSPSSSRVRAGFIVAAAFLTVMALFFIFRDPYRDAGGDMLDGGDFEQNPFGDRATQPPVDPATPRIGLWRVHGELVGWEPRGGFDSSGGMRLGTQQGRGSSLHYTVEDPRRFRFLRLSGRVRSERIVVGEPAWHTARLLLYFTDRDGHPHWERPHEVCAIAGTQSWRECTQVFPVPDFAAAAHVSVQNDAASGTLWVDGLRLTPALESSSTFFWRVTFATLWCGVLAYCVWIARLSRQMLGLPIIGIGMVIIAGVGIPEGTLEQMANRVAEGLHSLVNRPDLGKPPSPPTARLPGPPASAVGAGVHSAPLSSRAVVTVKKVGHFVLFGLLALLVFSSAIRRWDRKSTGPRPAAAFATIVVALLLFAGGAEVVQFLTRTRTPSLLDWAIDAAGLLLGASIALLIRRARSADSSRSAA